ncbi:outer membrane porin, OprD family [Pseudomonas helleri]|uniref:Outer membrane porin, OprD family n=1 Tax=Pseudomonas helleri TaxID=1608996 RepID=A0A7X2BHD5_9PSED|nr:MULTISPECIES: OprD family porin [Pseudomonas]MQT46170.1 outer membrane porin, OprD family [Pseudomonas helleri]MQT57306.1 outer membrane porin, OprD family [Pseudomonas sp. FSL R10-0399]MQT88254.1 outer membrane porin, OprD family [Pseudomonas helleri]
MNTSTLALAVVAGTVGLHYTQLSSANEFIENSKASLSLRNFYFNQDNRSGEASPSKTEEWGQGFLFNYESGYTEGTVGVGVDVLGRLGIKLDSGGRVTKAGRSRNPGQLFPQDSDGSAVDEFGSVGLTGKLRLSKTEARFGTLQPRLPVVVFNDGRMLPQTFTGGQITSNELDNLTLIGGQLEHAQGRASSDAQSMSVAGANDRETGKFSNKFYYGGADYRLGKTLLLQYYYGNLKEFYAQHFLGLTHTLTLPVGTLLSDLRYFRSIADGHNASAAGRAEGYQITDARLASDPDKGKVDSTLLSANFTWKVDGHAFSLGYQENHGLSEHARINQGDGVSSYDVGGRMIGSFLRPEQRTWLGSYSYDFAAFGAPGLTLGLTYNKGSNIAVAGQSQSEGEWERDFRIAYAVQSGPLQGLGLAWMNASLRSSLATQRNIDENRIILSYALALF